MKILCIGHAAYDITLPVEYYPIENKKVRLKTPKVECGGGPSATAAYLLSKWGVDAYFAGVIGNDYYGMKIKDEFINIGVNTKYLEINNNFSTTSSYIIANKENGSRTIITNKDSNLKFNLVQKIDEEFAYILVDGDELELSRNTILKNKGKSITMIDAGKCDYNTVELAHFVDYLVCSNDFARDYTKLELDYDNLDSISLVYDKLYEEFKNNIIITLESKGSFTKINGESVLVPSLKVKDVDSTGAGDIYHGSLLYFLSSGYELTKAMRLANITSALSVLKIGGRYSIPLKEEVLEYDK